MIYCIEHYLHLMLLSCCFCFFALFALAFDLAGLEAGIAHLPDADRHIEALADDIDRPVRHFDDHLDVAVLLVKRRDRRGDVQPRHAGRCGQAQGAARLG